MTRRRIYLMRHGQVAYFENGRPLRQHSVPLTAEGREQATAAAKLLDGIAFDRVVTSDLPRTIETARIVAPSAELESWPELREIESGRLDEIPEDALEATFVGAWRDVVPEDTQFLGGETIRSLLDRVLPTVDRLIGDPDWDVLLAPAINVLAYPHIERAWPMDDSDLALTLDVNGQRVPYLHGLGYPAMSTVAGQPATAFPVGLSRAGLPIGLQAVGPYLEDLTPIRFAALLAQEIGGFRKPSGYDDP